MTKNEFTPLVAIVITAYNKEKFLRNTIESVLKQSTSFDYAVILSEDLGGDSSRAICEEYAAGEGVYGRAKVLNISGKEHLGVAANAYKCMKYALSLGVKYITQIDGDDLWADRDLLQSRVDFLEWHKEYSLAITDYFSVGESVGLQEVYALYDRVNASKSRRYKDAKIGVLDLLATSKMEGGFFFRSEGLSGFFEKFAEGGSFLTQDLPLWLWLSLSGKFAKSNIKSLAYRILQESGSHSADVSKMERYQRNMADIRLKFIDLFYTDPKTNARLKRKVERFYTGKMLRITAKIAPKDYVKFARKALGSMPSLLCSKAFVRSVAVFLKNKKRRV